MISATLVGLVLGMVISIPVGPVNIAVLQVTLKEGKRNAVFVGFGGAIMDAIYLSIALLGVHQIDLTNPVFQYVAYLGVVFLLVLGIKELLYKEDDIIEVEKELQKPNHQGRYFTLGILFYLTNPMIIIGLASIAAMLRKWDWLKTIGFNMEDTASNWWLTGGVLVGSALWFVLFSFIVDRFKKKMNHTFLQRVNKGAGVMLIVLGLILLAKLTVWN